MASIFKKSNRKDKRNYVLNPKENWISRYVEITSHLSFRDFDKNWFEQIQFDIIHDLYDESLDNEIILHLLSLLELMFPTYDANEK